MNDTYHPEKGPYLRTLNPGEQFIGFFALRSKELEPFRDPSRGSYLTLVLSDRSGQMVGRVWENAEMVQEEIEQGRVVKVDGEVDLYRDRPQIIVRRIRLAHPEEYDMRDMVPSSPRDPDEMVAALQSYIESLSNSHLRALVDAFYSDPNFLAQYVQAPAARRIHHAYTGGLLEHTLEVLALCQTVLELYPQLDADLLIAGALLHDIGKLREYSWDVDIDFTTEGRLIGHIVMTDEMIRGAIQNMRGFPAELALRLRHMLISHHGRTEWGSPREPQTLEAIALHHIENLDVQINRFQQILERKPSGEAWTPFDRLLRRQLYAGTDEGASADEPDWTD